VATGTETGGRKLGGRNFGASVALTTEQARTLARYTKQQKRTGRSVLALDLAHEGKVAGEGKVWTSAGRKSSRQ
jgi:hypothetical protein